jgi:hypothetical protein
MLYQAKNAIQISHIKAKHNTHIFVVMMVTQLF